MISPESGKKVIIPIYACIFGRGSHWVKLECSKEYRIASLRFTAMHVYLEITLLYSVKGHPSKHQPYSLDLFKSY